MTHSLLAHFKVLGGTLPVLPKFFCAKDVRESLVVAGAISVKCEPGALK